MSRKQTSMSDEPLHVVLGAAGGTGGAIVRLLAADGRRVRAVARRTLPFGDEVEQTGRRSGSVAVSPTPAAPPATSPAGAR
jgi:NAD(P)-dependent dehydrogenase (short-subunit alcohol dehydrogenase family)